MTFPRAIILVALLAAVAAFQAGGQPPKKPAISPEEAKVRALVEAPLRFAASVFSTQKFPPCAFDNPAVVKNAVGEYRIKTAFYDRKLQPVTLARAPGVYGAVVEITSDKGPRLRRYFTLYRTAKEIPAGTTFAPKRVAELLGIDPTVVQERGALFARLWGKRTFTEFARDPNAGRFVAGLSLSTSSPEPLRKFAEPIALERQWWVTLKRRLTGLDRDFARPVVAPTRIKGQPAPVVRKGTAAEAGMRDDAAEKIDAICRTWAADDDQAFAVCIVRRGVIVLHKAYGMRDGKPMTLTTKSWMASITKPLSATLMMMLVDRGLVGLDDPVEKFLPALRGRRKGNSLRIRQLYTHTSGLSFWPADFYRDELNDIEERVAVAYPFLRVGREFAYGGQSYALGGKVIEAVSGEAIPQFFQNHLLRPLGCEHTDVAGTHADALSVPLDIARFGQMLLNQGSYGKWQFFRPETFEQMLPHRLTKELGPDTKRTFGIGLDGKRERFGHGAASAATFSVDRANELVVVMTRNRMGKNQGKYGGKFLEAIRAGMKDPAGKK